MPRTAYAPPPMLDRHRLLRVRLLMLAAVVVAAIPAGLVLAQDAPHAEFVGGFTLEQTGQRFATLQRAIDAIGDGAGTIAIGPGTYRECAVQQQGDVAFVAQVPGQAVFDGGICEGKAALVLRGRSAKISGIVFQNMRVADGNGAGIRLEHGDLSVSQSWFRDSEEGILTADDPGAAILVEKSTFTRLGRCDRGLSCAHSIYVGDYGALTVRQSRFEAGRGGHYVKSRAARIEVTQSSFDDSAGRATNYMIDLSGGATGTITGNWFVQGQDKENYSAFITNAAEGHAHSAEGLVIAGNDARLAPGVSRSTVFVADWSGDGLQIGANTLGSGLARFEKR
ncbi:right-handed parallel beta-helix repeat-containing protein [Novosphingobium lentum]|uniref:right-handed parallel beta-helix repeat-containing protein n=1 Tax=Novosphingobium lentum TaxID=145287 RepID=UPI000B05F549|nr:right-handed parallel beta-helix repeat-containing protein [Novosphingobium lentum]